MQLGMKEKGNIHARSGTLIPFSIFFHLFGNDKSIRKTGKMYSTSKPSDELLTIFFSPGGIEDYMTNETNHMMIH